MKIHAVALCIAGTLVTGVAARADNSADNRITDRTAAQASEREAYNRDARGHHGDWDYDAVDNITGYSTYAGGRIWHREVLFPGMESPAEVARKVSDMITKQRTEIAELRALAPRAQTAGYTNVSTVYDRMADDHAKLVSFGTDWLSRRNFAIPAEPAATDVAYDSAEKSVDHEIMMHQQAFNDALAMRENENSPTVRGMALWAAATAARHISILETLDRDLDFGQKTVSLSLQAELDGTVVASNGSNSTTLIVEEQMARFRSLNPDQVNFGNPPTQVVEVEVEKPVIQERIVERVVEKPVDRIVEKPVIQERIVERKVYVQQPARSKVAGTRQSTGSRRARRPAY